MNQKKIIYKSKSSDQSNLMLFIYNLIKNQQSYKVIKKASFMSWPYQFNYPQNPQFLNRMTDYQNHIYSFGFNQNHFNQILPNQYYCFNNEFPIFTPQFNLHEPNCFQTSQFNQQICEHPLKVENSIQNIQTFQNRQEMTGKSQQSDYQFELCQKKIMVLHQQKFLKKSKNIISHNCALRNDTKNIPKNYGKAMLSYIQKNVRQVKQILSKYQVDFLEFMIFVKSYKSKINTIHDLRQMWGQDDKENKLMKCIRVLSYHFLRKKCLPHIFNSRIKNLHTHIKYRKKIMQGIQNPENFTKIKQF